MKNIVIGIIILILITLLCIQTDEEINTEPLFGLDSLFKD